MAYRHLLGFSRGVSAVSVVWDRSCLGRRGLSAAIPIAINSIICQPWCRGMPAGCPGAPPALLPPGVAGFMRLLPGLLQSAASGELKTLALVWQRPWDRLVPFGSLARRPATAAPVFPARVPEVLSRAAACSKAKRIWSWMCRREEPAGIRRALNPPS